MRNIRLNLFSLAFVTACCLLFVTSVLKGQTYQVIIFDPPSGFNETDGKGVSGSQRVGAGRVEGAPNPEDTHALLWIGASISPLDLNPSGYLFSRANATDGARQVGSAWRPYPWNDIGMVAALWNGSAQSFVPLCALPYCGVSEAFAIAGNQQVGYTDDSFSCSECGQSRIIHAALWRDTPSSHIDLHPNPNNHDDESRAFDTDGVQQVGYKYYPGTSRPYRALLWSGTAQSAVDLSTPAFAVTFAYAVKNGVQVGTGQNYDADSLTPPHALVWHGNAASLTDLGEGTIRDTNGTTHVGAIAAGYSSHAFRWDGAGMGIDLHNLLPAGVFVNSGAEDIDEAGNIIGWAQRADSYYLEAVLWRVAESPNQAPSVTLSRIRSKQFAVSSPVKLDADASDADGSVVHVTYYANGIQIGTAGRNGAGRFPMIWRPDQTGTYRIEAQAMDNLGASTMSFPVTIRAVN